MKRLIAWFLVSIAVGYAIALGGLFALAIVLFWLGLYGFEMLAARPRRGTAPTGSRAPDPALDALAGFRRESFLEEVRLVMEQTDVRIMHPTLTDAQCRAVALRRVMEARTH